MMYYGIWQTKVPLDMHCDGCTLYAYYFSQWQGLSFKEVNSSL